MKTITNDKPLLYQALKAAEESLKQQANILGALALASKGGADTDLLRPADVMRAINCKETKARMIVREHGTGSGKMRRISRGTLMQLLEEGKL